MELRVRSSDDLAALAGWAARRGIRRIKVELDGRRPAARLESLSAAINRDLRACGCIEATVLCLAALISVPWIGVTFQSRLPEHWHALTALGFAYVLAAALLGKIAGLWLAERRLAGNVRMLKTLLHEPTETASS